MSQVEKQVLITGDFVMDHHIYEGQRHQFGDHRSRGVREVIELGGAALVHHLLAELNFSRAHLTVAMDRHRQPPGGATAVPDELNAYAFWRPFPRKEKDPDSAVWRVAEAMGFGALSVPPPTFSWPLPEASCERPRIVVVSDGGMGFRRDESCWPMAALKDAQWIVLKTAHPLAEGKLWQTLVPYSDKLVVIVSAAELRKSTAQVSSGLSWEETLESVCRAIEPRGALAGLARCRHLVITFDSDGALWIDQCQDADKRQGHLVYEAASAEGESRLACKGNTFGVLSCLTAAVVWRLAVDRGCPDLETALEGGLSAMRDLLENGHGRAAAVPEGFPAKRLAKVIKEAACRYSRAAFLLSSTCAAPACGLEVAPGAKGRCWSVLHEALRELGKTCPEPAFPLAELVARRGPIALGSLPHLQIGGLMSADRREVEALRVLRRMILDYGNPHNPGRRPLSLGVFGPPGAGKSFAVKQIAEALLGDKGWMEFNLSQFKEGTDDLIGAFHQIRDRVLRGTLPVAFFDEFDSREYYWLQYLLAPMQDGAFQEGQITHPIGKCIFVFAGGTSHTFDTFGPLDTNEAAYARFRLAKGPDFKSRLDGFLDVLGPNRAQSLHPGQDGKNYEPEDDRCDIFFPIRRALILRSELGLSRTDKLDIDQGLLRAILRVSKYTHGARSLGKIVEPMRAALTAFLNRSLTPPWKQLAIHVDANEFLAICRQSDTAPPRAIPLSDAARETLAEAVHETWRVLGREAGWLAKGDDKDFHELGAFLKNSNLAAVDRMAGTLDLIGLALAPGDATEEEVTHTRRKIEYHLELLAEAEHNGWMVWYLDQGWQWGPVKDENKQTHPCLKPYALLPDQEKNKDRNAVRHYPDFARGARMHITSVAESGDCPVASRANAAGSD